MVKSFIIFHSVVSLFFSAGAVTLIKAKTSEVEDLKKRISFEITKKEEKSNKLIESLKDNSKVPRYLSDTHYERRHLTDYEAF